MSDVFLRVLVLQGALVPETRSACLFRSFNNPDWISKGIPHLLGRKPDVTRLEQIVSYQPQKKEKSHPWVGLDEDMNENFAAMSRRVLALTVTFMLEGSGTRLGLAVQVWL